MDKFVCSVPGRSDEEDYYEDFGHSIAVAAAVLGLGTHDSPPLWHIHFLGSLGRGRSSGGE